MEKNIKYLLMCAAIPTSIALVGGDKVNAADVELLIQLKILQQLVMKSQLLTILWPIQQQVTLIARIR